MSILYGRLAKYYDLFYEKMRDKDYRAETNFITHLFHKHKVNVKDILVAACGTGNHEKYLAKKYRVVGIDLHKEMLVIARKKVKNAKYYQMDIRKLRLRQRFNAILCLFSSMFYMQTISEVQQTLKKFYNHLKPEGIVVFDMGILRETFKEGYKDVQGVETPQVSLARFGRSERQGSKGRLYFTYLVREGEKLTYWKDVHKIGLFTRKQYADALRKAGFRAYIYNGFTLKKGTKDRNVIFVGVKE